MKTTWLMASAAMIVASAVTMAAGGPAWEPKNGKQKAAPPAEAFAAAVPITTGVVKQFVINPYGEVDGLVLENSTLAKFPPHMSVELTAAVRQGDTVSVRGLREYAGTVRALVITNEGSQRTVIEHPPVPAIAEMPKHLRFAMLNRLQAAGTVERALYGRRGEINGTILNDGTVVRFPPHAAYQFAPQLQPGQPIAVEGLGTQNDFGRGIEALAIGPNPQALQPIYNRPLGGTP